MSGVRTPLVLPMTPDLALLLLGQRRRKVAVVTAELLVVVVAVVAGAVLSLTDPSTRTVRVVAAGDIACDPQDPYLAGDQVADRCRHAEVATLAAGLRPDLLLGLGDYQYETPTADAYRDVYGPSWGRLRAKTVPVFGNQEYTVADARPFVDYFGDRIGDPRGYWSQQVGAWHLVVLNSNCSSVDGGCGEGSPQQQWLDADLAAGHRCVLAAWHHPRWSSGIAGPDGRTDALYQTLFAHGVELVLSGHEADYERFGPLDPAGEADARGVRQFVVGTGGQVHYRPEPQDSPWRGKITAPKSEYVDYDHHGVLELELSPGRWRWRFHPLDAPLADEGAGICV